MRTFILRLDSLVRRRRRLVVAAWLAIVLAAVPFALRQSNHLTGGGFDIPGSQSQAVQDAVLGDFDRAQDGELGAVLRAERGAGAQGRAAGLDRLRLAAGAVPGVSLARGAARRAADDLRSRGVAVVPLTARGPRGELIDAAGELRDRLRVGAPVEGVQAYVVGREALWAGLQDLSKEDLAGAEATGFPIVALILLAAFGSLAAASLPLALGIGSVMVTGALIYFIAQAIEMSVFVTNMASMIGIGVAVDYSLFILARYREEVRAGRSPDEARTEALQTSGLAVAFSGLAVIVSLASLWVVDNQALRSMALGAMMVVAVSVLTAVILLPALMSLLGKRAYARGRTAQTLGLLARLARTRRRRAGSTSPEAVDGRGFWQRWAERVMRRPVLSVVAVSSVLLTLAVPVLSLRTGEGALRQFPAGHETRVGAELAAGPSGRPAGEVKLLVRFERGGPADPANRRLAAGLVRALRREKEVRSVAAPLSSGDRVLLTAKLRPDSESRAAQAFVDRLRERVVPAAVGPHPAEVAVGGHAAGVRDFHALINGSLWKIVAIVLGLSFVVLTLMLRSILLPLKAVLMNLLSIGAAFGVLVAVFQWGWLDGIAGFQSLGYLDTLTVPLVLAVVFGLSMDYEVFLLSRIREGYEAHGDNRRAVAEGLASSARTISSAALIMASVFLVFVGTGVPSIKELGLGNAVAVTLDATLVRLILVPAAMQLMGRWNWWMPERLDRVLPRLDFERRRPRQAGAEA